MEGHMTILRCAGVIAEMFIHPGLVEAMPVGRLPATNAYGRLAGSASTPRRR
jgi:hypothetical protein